MRFSDALKGYWLANKPDRAESTFASYSRVFSRFEEWIADEHVEKMTHHQLNGYLNYLMDERSLQPQSVKNHWIALSSFWKWTSKEMEILNVFAEHVAGPKVRHKMRSPFTKEEVKLISKGVRYMKSYDRVNDKYVEAERSSYVRDIAILALFLDTGIRVGELCDLNIMDFNRQNGRLVILHGKGDKQRVLPMGDRSRRRLWQYLTKRDEYKAADPLFVTRNGKRMERNHVYQILAHAGRRYGVKAAGPHRFRHTFAINFLRNGGSPLELQRMLGHEKLETVLIYVRLVEVDIESAQKRASVGDAWNV